MILAVVFLCAVVCLFGLACGILIGAVMMTSAFADQEDELSEWRQRCLRLEAGFVKAHQEFLG